jgi:1,4-alpha-glucan branching enzyme
MVTVKGSLAEFSFFRPQAEQVHLVGDFTHWQRGGIAMVRTPDGYWRTNLHLPPGEFMFRYRADGHWFTDFAAFGVEQGTLGLNSVVRMG